MIVKSSSDLSTELVELIKNYEKIVSNSELIKQLKLMKSFYNLHVDQKSNKTTFGISYDYRRKIILLNTYIERDVIKNTVYRAEFKLTYLEEDEKMINKIQKLYLLRLKKILAKILDISKNEQNDLFLNGNILLSDIDMTRLNIDINYKRGNVYSFENSSIASVQWDVNSIEYLLEKNQKYLGNLLKQKEISNRLDSNNLVNLFIALFQFKGSITDNELYKFIVHYRYDELQTTIEFCNKNTKEKIVKLINTKNNILSKILGDQYSYKFGNFLTTDGINSINIKDIFDINLTDYHFNKNEKIEINIYLNSNIKEASELDSIYKVMSPEENIKMINKLYILLNKYSDHKINIYFNFKQNLNEIISRINYFATFSPSQTIREKATYVLNSFEKATHTINN